MTHEEKKVLKTAKKFLHYLLNDIAYQYDRLSTLERTLCTQEEFDAMVKWLKTEEKT